MSENEIINQLRTFRKVQREQLYSKLYPSYMETREEIQEEAREQIQAADDETSRLDKEWHYANSKWFNKDNARNISLSYTASVRLSESLNRKRDNKLSLYENTCELTTTLKEFDIETERMILAHICNVELICGQKMLVSNQTE